MGNYDKISKEYGEEIYDSLKNYLTGKKEGYERADDHTLQELAFYFNVLYDAKEYIIKNGYTDQNQNNIKYLNPQFKAIDRASKHIRDICTRIGIYEAMKNKLIGYGKMTEKVKSRTK